MPALKVIHRKIFLLGLIGAVFISGCSKREPEKPTGVIPAYQQRALEKAKNTQQVLQDAAEQQRKQMDAQGG